MSDGGRGVPLAQLIDREEEEDPMQRPAGDRYFEADISGYRTGRLAQDEGEPPAVQITEKNLQEVLAWERKLIDKAKQWNLTNLSKYLNQIAATIGIQVNTLIVIPAELLQPIHPYMADLSTEQARNIKLQSLLARNADTERRKRRPNLSPSSPPQPPPSLGGDQDDLALFQDAVTDIPSVDIPGIVDEGDDDDDEDDDDDFLNMTSFGKATPHQYQRGGAPIAFPSGVAPTTTTTTAAGQNRYTHPLTDLSTALNNPLIRARMELFYKHSNQMSVMSIISNPQFHGDINQVVKSAQLIGWEEDTLSRITSQPYTEGRFARAEPHHFYTDGGARRAFAQAVAAVARQNSTINNSATQMASREANSMLAEAIIKCTACVWAGESLVMDNQLYAELTSGASHTVPRVKRSTSAYARSMTGWTTPRVTKRVRPIFY